MTKAESSSAEPAGKTDSSPKKLDSARVTRSGSMRHVLQRSSSPSNRPGRRVAEYPREPASKNADACASDAKTEPAGRPGASSAATATRAVPSALAKAAS